MNKRTLLFVEIGVVAAVLFLLVWIILPKFIGAQNMNTPRVFPDDYMRASVERFMGVGTFEQFTRTQLGEKGGVLAIFNSHNFKGLENVKQVSTLNISSESPTETPVAVVLPELPEVYYFTLQGTMFELLDVSMLKKLQHLQTTKSPIKKLNIQGLEKLSTLVMRESAIESLNLSTLPNLTNLYVMRNNNLKTINLTHNDNLSQLNITFTPLESIDVSQCTDLKEIDLRFNKLANIDLSNNEKLIIAKLGSDTLESITLSNCENLEILDISNSKISEIDISPYQALRETFITNTLLKKIDATQNPNLQRIWISYDQLFDIEITYVNPNLNFEFWSPLNNYTVDEVNERKSEIFSANFPDLNLDDYVIKSQ